MKQTVEEAAREYIYKARASFVGITPEEYEEQINPEYPYNVGTDEDFESLFIAGADWQSKQSPWISVKERLPGKDGYYFVTDGDIVEKVYFYKVWNKFVSTKEYPHLFFNEGVIKAWLFIPSFDEILEANKDVLRIKEKGDCHDSKERIL